jgi:hypothetical protein
MLNAHWINETSKIVHIWIVFQYSKYLATRVLAWCARKTTNKSRRLRELSDFLQDRGRWMDDNVAIGYNISSCMLSLFPFLC